jgi:hypothetical protein
MSIRGRGERATAIAASLALALTLAGPAHAYDKQTCNASYEQAQKDRLDAKLRLAREQLLVCAHVTCPNVVARDCRQWRNEVEEHMASLLIVARDGRGSELRDVKVLVDGEVILDELDARPVFLDPGIHTLRCERRGSVAAEQKLRLDPGERTRLIEVKLAAAASEEPLPTMGPRPELSRPGGEQSSAVPARDAGVPPDTTSRRKSPGTATYILGGIGAVSLVSFAYLGLTGQSEASSMREVCAPRCAKSEVDAVRTKLIAANISLGVGLAALGAATVLWLSNGTSPSRATLRVDYGLLAGGGMGTIAGSF